MTNNRYGEISMFSGSLCSLIPASSSYVTPHQDRSRERLSPAPPLPACVSDIGKKETSVSSIEIAHSLISARVRSISDGLLVEGLIPDGSFYFNTLFFNSRRCDNGSEAKLASPDS